MADLDFLYLGGIELYIGCSVTVTEPKILQSIRNTKGGQVAQSMLRGAGQTITINALKDAAGIYGYITETQKADIEALRDAGQPVELEANTGTWQVIILRDGVNLEPHKKLVDDDADMEYYGTITTRTV